MKCSACNRTIQKPAAQVGKLTLGPACFRKLLAQAGSQQKGRRVIPQPELFTEICEVTA